MDSAPIIETSDDPPNAATRILLLPGWLDSGPGHWQSLWALRRGHRKVEQSDWVWPRRGDWMAQLEEVVLAHTAPAILVAHSLGCHLVATWADHSRHHARVKGALLVAPPDVERADMPPNVFNWRPAKRERLPFPSHMVASSNDPYASLARSQALAECWGSQLTLIGPCGHVNGDSGLGDWEQGLAILDSLLGTTKSQNPTEPLFDPLQ